jgi:hypothetical protein
LISINAATLAPPPFQRAVRRDLERKTTMMARETLVEPPDTVDLPATHFAAFAKAILLRGAGIDVVWQQFVAVFGIGLVFLVLALRRFRQITAASIA